MDGRSKASFGVHGVGSHWAVGTPTMRWRLSDSMALDLTVDLGLNKGSNGASSFDAFRTGMGLVHKCKEGNGFIVSVRLDAGYNYLYQRYPDPFSFSYVSHQVSLGFGPDIEYFIPAMPQLSIGAFATLAGSWYQQKESGSSKNEKSIGLATSGQLLTVRYYF